MPALSVAFAEEQLSQTRMAKKRNSFLVLTVETAVRVILHGRKDHRRHDMCMYFFHNDMVMVMITLFRHGKSFSKDYTEIKDKI